MHVLYAYACAYMYVICACMHVLCVCGVHIVVWFILCVCVHVAVMPLNPPSSGPLCHGDICSGSKHARKDCGLYKLQEV